MRFLFPLRKKERRKEKKWFHICHEASIKSIFHLLNRESSPRLVNSTNDSTSYRDHLGRMSSRANLHSNVAANYVPLSFPSSTSSLARDIVKRRSSLKRSSMHRYIYISDPINARRYAPPPPPLSSKNVMRQFSCNDRLNPLEERRTSRHYQRPRRRGKR